MERIYSLLQEYVEKRYNQFNGDYSSGIGVMRTASGASKERYAAIAEQGKTALLGNAMNTPDIYSKNYFGDIDLGDDFRRPFASDIRTLFISGTMDSNTPPSNAEKVKSLFTNAGHMLVDMPAMRICCQMKMFKKRLSIFTKETKLAQLTFRCQDQNLNRLAINRF